MIVANKPGQTQVEFINFVLEHCCNCGAAFMVPESFQKHCKADSAKHFYCPNGHSQHYLQSEADRLKDKIADVEAKHKRELEAATNRTLDAIIEKQKAQFEKEKLEKQMKRVRKGVCPCCNRSFANLKKHMTTKHPEAIK